MHFEDRLRYGLQSDLGRLLLLLLAAFVCLLVLYLFLRYQSQQKSALAVRFQNHYRTAEHILLQKKITLLEAGKSDFWGRKVVVKDEAQQFALCSIPSPDIATASFTVQLAFFYQAAAIQNISLLPSTEIEIEEPALIALQKEVVSTNGKLCIRVNEYCLDHKLTTADSESILLSLAKGLATLHELTTEQGSKLYYGWLMPQSLLLEVDHLQRIQKVLLADAGFAFALTPQKMQRQLQHMEKGKLPLTKTLQKELMQQFRYLAPEQKDPKQCHFVGPASDFFSFAALSSLLFTKQPFENVHKVDWTLVPQTWHSFLQACFASDTAARPKDFLELHDRLQDPELMFALSQNECAVSCLEELKVEDSPFKQLKELRLSMQEEGTTANTKQDSISHFLLQVEEVLHKKKWKQAKKLCKEALQTPQNASEQVALLHTFLAIACYEVGEMQASEKHYIEAKNLDSAAARRFRQHIAFRM